MKPLVSPARVWRLRESHYRLVGGRCRDCGLAFFPYSPRCPRCGSKNVERYTLPRRGVLEQYTIVYQVPEEMRDQAPLAYGIVRLEDGTRLAVMLTEASEARPGLRVEAVFRRVIVDGHYGLIAYGTRWRPERIQGR